MRLTAVVVFCRRLVARFVPPRIAILEERHISIKKIWRSYKVKSKHCDRRILH
jgi:hypothetical protein